MDHRQRAIRDTIKELGWAYPELRWLSEAEAAAAGARRDELLAALGDRAFTSFHGNKPHVGGLSPGCRICGEGDWSCLFMTGACTADCFFCPQTPAKLVAAPPTTVGLAFRDAAEYADFVEQLGYRGVGLSGGEPLLVFDQTLSYVRELKRRRGGALYVWLYTNGDLVDEEKADLLGDAGLDELRFDSAARGYDLARLRRVLGRIPTVTVEIPMIPEDAALLRDRLPRMAEAGVRYLNVHQLSARASNYRALAARGYTLLHQPNTPVLESELAALGLLGWALDCDLPLAINYCTAAYKHRLQPPAYRARAGRLIREGFEDCTETGHLRRVSLGGSSEELAVVAQQLAARDPGASRWAPGGEGAPLLLSLALLPGLDLGACTGRVDYDEPGLREATDRDPASRAVALGSGRRLAAARQPRASFEDLSPAALAALYAVGVAGAPQEEALRTLAARSDLHGPAGIQRLLREREVLEQAWEWERIPWGLPQLW